MNSSKIYTVALLHIFQLVNTTKLIQVLLWEQLHCWKKSETLSWRSFPVDTTSMNCGVKSQDGPLFLEVAPWDLSIPSLF